jgi:hypothetical protein
MSFKFSKQIQSESKNTGKKKSTTPLIAIQFTNISKSGTNSIRGTTPHSRESPRESQRMGELMA